MNKLLLLRLLLSIIVLSGCTSYDAEFNECKVIKVQDSGCARFTKFTCDNRTLDYALEKECYKEIHGYVTYGLRTDIPINKSIPNCVEIEVVYENGTINKCADQSCMPEYLALYTNRTNITRWYCKLIGE